MDRVAVIMSVYFRERLKNVKLGVESILNQTYKAVDLYIIEDGAIPLEVHKYLKHLAMERKIILYKRKRNRGLAHSLNDLLRIVLEKDYTFIARMDTDFCYPERIEKQINFLKEHPDIDIVGTNAIEINENGSDFFKKKFSENTQALKDNIAKRVPILHPTLVARRVVFTNIRYDKYDKYLTEDYRFFIDALAYGFNLSNVQAFLYKQVLDRHFFIRRRGIKRALKDMEIRWYAIKKLHAYSLKNFIYLFEIFVLRILPAKIMKWAYKHFRD